jgi:ribosomal protein S18 acetylase RimI-like enzyme
MSVWAASDVRAADATEIDHLAKVWYDGWQDAHAAILPAELAHDRTLESFRNRLAAALPTVRVIGPLGNPVGFCMVKGEELYQLYVSTQSRGSGVAAALVADAEARLVENGVETAWLACAIGNDRAARFYEKCGWRRVGTFIHHAETSEGTFALETWRYEKSLRPSGAAIAASTLKRTGAFPMAEERRKGPADRRRRSPKPAQAGEQSVTQAAGIPDTEAEEKARAQDPNDVARFDAEQLDAAIRAREQEERGEVF